MLRNPGFFRISCTLPIRSGKQQEICFQGDLVELPREIIKMYVGGLSKSGQKSLANLGIVSQVDKNIPDHKGLLYLV